MPSEPETTAADLKRAAVGMPPTMITSERRFEDVDAELTGLQARQLALRQEQPTLRAALERAQAAYRQALVTVAPRVPVLEEQTWREAEQALARSVDLDAGLESAIVALRPVWAQAKASELQREVVSLQRERTALEAEGARLETDIRVLQAQRYQNHVDVDAVTAHMRERESEVTRLWRETEAPLSPPTAR